MVVVRMISPKTGFLSFGKVLVRLLNSSVLRTLHLTVLAVKG